MIEKKNTKIAFGALLDVLFLNNVIFISLAKK